MCIPLTTPRAKEKLVLILKKLTGLSYKNMKNMRLFLSLSHTH